LAECEVAELGPVEPLAFDPRERPLSPAGRGLILSSELIIHFVFYFLIKPRLFVLYRLPGVENF
jgi:hypothetical protein